MQNRSHHCASWPARRDPSWSSAGCRSRPGACSRSATGRSRRRGRRLRSADAELADRRRRGRRRPGAAAAPCAAATVSRAPRESRRAPPPAAAAPAAVWAPRWSAGVGGRGRARRRRPCARGVAAGPRRRSCARRARLTRELARGAVRGDHGRPRRAPLARALPGASRRARRRRGGGRPGRPRRRPGRRRSGGASGRSARSAPRLGEQRPASTTKRDAGRGVERQERDRAASASRAGRGGGRRRGGVAARGARHGRTGSARRRRRERPARPGGPVPVPSHAGGRAARRPHPPAAAVVGRHSATPAPARERARPAVHAGSAHAAGSGVRLRRQSAAARPGAAPGASPATARASRERAREPLDPPPSRGRPPTRPRRRPCPGAASWTTPRPGREAAVAATAGGGRAGATRAAGPWPLPRPARAGGLQLRRWRRGTATGRRRRCRRSRTYDFHFVSYIVPVELAGGLLPFLGLYCGHLCPLGRKSIPPTFCPLLRQRSTAAPAPRPVIVVFGLKPERLVGAEGRIDAVPEPPTPSRPGC